jgi:hypothetical protein
MRALATGARAARDYVLPMRACAPTPFGVSPKGNGKGAEVKVYSLGAAKSPVVAKRVLNDVTQP